MARDFQHKPSIKFNEVYAPIARFETIRIVVSTATYHGWKIHQLDVKPTFFNGPLKEEVYCHSATRIPNQRE